MAKKDQENQDVGAADATPAAQPPPETPAAKPSYLALVNPHGEVVTMNDDEKGRTLRLELLRNQKPPDVETRKWWRDAEPAEIAAYQEQTGHFYVGETAKRRDWEKRRSER